MSRSGSPLFIGPDKVRNSPIGRAGLPSRSKDQIVAPRLRYELSPPAWRRMASAEMRATAALQHLHLAQSRRGGRGNAAPSPCGRKQTSEQPTLRARRHRWARLLGFSGAMSAEGARRYRPIGLQRAACIGPLFSPARWRSTQLPVLTLLWLRYS